MAIRRDRTPILRHSLAAVAACSLLLSGCNLGCMFMPCEGSLDAGVTVKDPAGAALGGVEVTVLGDSAETDSDGCVAIHTIYHAPIIRRVPNVTLSAERAGYKPLSAERPFGFYRIDVTLQPAGSSKPSSAVWTVVESTDSLPCSGNT